MRLPALVALVLAPRLAAAQESAAFLKLGAGARAMAMGGAYTAAADDASAVYWNPAGLSGMTRREASATHADLFANARHDFFAFAQPTRRGTFAAAVECLSQAAIPGRDEAGAPTGSYRASDAAILVAYADKVSSVAGLGLGAGMKYIKSGIADVSAQTYAFDFGARYAPRGAGAGPLFGLAVQNLGPGLKFLEQRSPLPLTIAGGAAYRLSVDLLLALDWKYHPHNPPGGVGVGSEYRLFSSFAVRAGYDSSTAGSDGEPGLAAMSGFTAGFGLVLSSYSLDYSIAPMGERGNAQRFSLDARF